MENEILESIRSQIGNGQTSEALTRLESYIPPTSEEYNSYCLLKSRYNSLQKKVFLGLLSYEEYSKEENNINFGLLEFITKIQSFKQISVDDVKAYVSNHCDVFSFKHAMIGRNDLPFKAKYKVHQLDINDSGEFRVICSYSTENNTRIKSFLWGSEIVTINRNEYRHILGDLSEIDSIEIEDEEVKLGDDTLSKFVAFKIPAVNGESLFKVDVIIEVDGKESTREGVMNGITFMVNSRSTRLEKMRNSIEFLSNYYKSRK